MQENGRGPLKNLIYTIAFGSDAWHQAVMMVDSIRRVGQFEGDIKVFSDTDAEMLGAEVIYSPLADECYSIMAVRWLIGRGLDVSQYDQVAMIDADILAINPIQELFDLGRDFPGVRVCEEFPDGRVVSGNSPWSIIGLPFDGDKPVHNCGTVIARSSYWNHFSNLMCEFMRITRPMIKQPYVWIDQQVLNYLIRSNLVPLYQIPDNWVYIFRSGTEVGPECKLVHMLPNGKDRLMRAMYGIVQNKHRA